MDDLSMLSPLQLPALARARHDDFEVMRYQLIANDDITDDQLDAIVAKIAEPIIARTDCTQCGNCCRSLDVYLTPDDAQRLAAHIHIPLSAILDHPRAQAVEEWGMFKDRPCRFLVGNLCTVYDHRPQTCRDYPVFTPDFRWMLADIIGGAAICPIIYQTLCAVYDYVEHELYAHD
jgi:hypothetical protein